MFMEQSRHYPSILYNKICGYLNFHECYYVAVIHRIHNGCQSHYHKLVISTKLEKIYDFFKDVIDLKSQINIVGYNNNDTDVIAHYYIQNENEAILSWLANHGWNRGVVQGCQADYMGSYPTRLYIFITKCPCQNDKIKNLDKI